MIKIVVIVNSSIQCHFVIMLLFLCHLVIEVLNLLPLDSFLRIFFLARTKITNTNTENTFLAFPIIIISSWQEQKPLTFPIIFHLFSLHCQLYEDLLQLLVDKIDAELLEAVLLEDLKAVDVEDADAEHLLL